MGWLLGFFRDGCVCVFQSISSSWPIVTIGRGFVKIGLRFFAPASGRDLMLAPCESFFALQIRAETAK
jgi:hypothetical protein